MVTKGGSLPDASRCIKHTPGCDRTAIDSECYILLFRYLDPKTVWIVPIKLERAITSWPKPVAYTSSQSLVCLLYHTFNVYSVVDISNHSDPIYISVSSVGCHFSDDLWSNCWFSRHATLTSPICEIQPFVSATHICNSHTWSKTTTEHRWKSIKNSW